MTGIDQAACAEWLPIMSRDRTPSCLCHLILNSATATTTTAVDLVASKKRLKDEQITVVVALRKENGMSSTDNSGTSVVSGNLTSTQELSFYRSISEAVRATATAAAAVAALQCCFPLAADLCHHIHARVTAADLHGLFCNSCIQPLGKAASVERLACELCMI